MDKALQVINEMQASGVIKSYAIGGGIAAIFYIEPILTYDLDVFFTPSQKDEGLLGLSSIYDYLKKRGYLPEKEHIVIENIPVQFLPVFNELIEEAVDEAVTAEYKDTVTRIIKPEYLMAIMLQTFRPKDRERILKFLEDAEFDKEVLEKVLNKFNLTEKFMRLQSGR
jgi:hypothetical protein